MWRRLFQRFKQGVKCLPGEHVYLINDENLVRPALGWYPDDFTQMVDILHLIIGRRIHLDHIQGAAERLPVYRLVNLLDRSRKNPRHRRSTHSPGATEPIVLGESVLPDGILQGAAYMLLGDHILKFLRPVFSG